MLSILGATQDDIEEILKGLGYRADAVPAEEAQSHIASLDAAQAESAGAAGTGPVVEVVVSRTAADRPHKPVSPAAEQTASADAAADETVKATAEVPADTAEAPASGEETGAQPAEVSTDSVAAEADAPAAEETPAGDAPKAEAAEEAEAPRPVLLWRPGGRQDGQRGPRNAPGEGRGRREAGNRNARSGEKQEGEGASEGEGRPNRGHRGKPGHQGKGGPGRGGPGRGGQGKGRQDGEANRGGRNNDRPQRKEKPIDPDSPFAALAALRDQLKK